MDKPYLITSKMLSGSQQLKLVLSELDCAEPESDPKGRGLRYEIRKDGIQPGDYAARITFRTALPELLELVAFDGNKQMKHMEVAYGPVELISNTQSIDR